MTKAIKIKNIEIGAGLPKICVPLTGKTQKELYKEAKAAEEAKADLVEWRADFYEDLLEKEALSETLKGIAEILKEIPLLFTIRTKQEGGSVEISFEDYSNCNKNAAEAGADLVDVEVFGEEEKKKALILELHKTKAVIIASSHDFFKTDACEILLERFQKMDQTGADILKIAVMPQCFEDVTAIMCATEKMAASYTERPLISMSMGRLGAMSRVYGEAFGSSVTFGTVGAASAPGQIPVPELRAMLSLFKQH